MANPEHLAILKQGVEVWNKWRKENPEVCPNLSYCNLNEYPLVRGEIILLDIIEHECDEVINQVRYIDFLDRCEINDRVGLNLGGADMNHAEIRGAYVGYANMRGADLSHGIFNRSTFRMVDFGEAILEGADFRWTNLVDVDLCGAWMNKVKLSGCVLNEKTLTQTNKVDGVEVGVNGIYCSATDSAALMQMTPPGNSMQGSNADAIVESLKHARKLHNISLGFAGVALLIAVLKPEFIKIPFFPDFSSEPTHYAVLAIFCSVGILTLTESFIRAGLEGARYINNRDSAMKVGHFPWTISKYDKGKWGKWQSMIMRLILCFHPLVYPALYFSVLPNPLSALFPAGAGWLFYLGNRFVVLAFFGLLALCGRIFWLSQQFQKPILFDPETERNRKSEAAILNDKITELIEILKPKEPITKNSVEEVSAKDPSL